MRSVLQVNDASTEVPIEGASEDVVVGGAVVALSSQVSADSKMTGARICISGAADVRLTFDGSSPVGGTSGEVWFPGGILKVNREQFDKIKVVRDALIDSSVHVTQLMGGRLRG